MTASTSSSRTERFLKSLRQNLTEGNYYEGHQELRAIASRYVKQKKPSQAIRLLYLGALELCQYHQWGSVADLISYMINLYQEEHVEVTAESKERVFDVFEKLSQATEYYGRVYEAAIQWTVAEMGGAGDPQMHHFVACVLRTKARYPEAESHFLVGTPESPAALGSMLFDWASRTGATDYGVFVARGVLRYLALGWYEGACFCWRAFMNRMATALSDIVTEKAHAGVPSKIGPVYFVTGGNHQQVNFVQLLLLAVERSDGSPHGEAAKAFEELRRRYEESFGVNAGVVHDLMDGVAEKYFGVVVHRQQSLFDIVNSLFAPPPSRPAISSGKDAVAENEAMD
ncbi:hypothetical protein GGI07_000220 [Coemansia sp. Benny D115]|nr:hypothetical protein GGI07_000220 [Coemansia sp. Benny D115]